MRKINEKKRLVKFAFFAVFLITGVLGMAGKSEAATYYVDNNVIDDSGTGTEVSPKKYIKSGISLMSSGDTLIIKDGVYTGDNNCLYFYGGVPNGIDGNYTIIKAENDFGVIIDGEGVRSTWYMGNDSNPVSYVQIEGMVFRNSNKNNFQVVGNSSSHVKVLRCASYEAGDGDSFNFASQGEYHLFEDCFAWGRGRYKFVCGTRNTILRRCVARYDYHNPDVVGDTGWPDPYADFAFYHHEDGVMQNCIAIDSLDTNSVRPDPETRAFQSANGSDRVTIDSCIALNINGRGIVWESTNPDSFIKNSIVWDVGSYSIIPIYLSENHPVTIDHNTIGTITNPYNVISGINTWSGVTNNGMPVTNNLIYGITGSGLYGIRNSDYLDHNALYNNQSDYSGCSAGTHDLTISNNNAIDPIDGSPGNNFPALKYLVRIEDGSDLDGAGSGGLDIGATIIKRLGKSGTVYGENGWDELQDGTDGQEDVNLWPFPNENKIKELMSSYNLHSISGARGFAASDTGLYDGPITLTSYIWEYLGNACPPEICNYSQSEDVLSPNAPSGLTVR